MKWCPIALSVFLVVAATVASSRAQAPAPKFDQRVQLDVTRAKKTRIEGGDADDKVDRIVLKAVFINNDIATSYKDCKAEIYVWAEHIVNRKAYKLLGKEHFTFSLAPRESHTFTTAEVETAWDKTVARFGAKYDGWVVVVRDEAGTVLMKKSTSPMWLPVAEKLSDLTVGKSYNRDLKVVPMTR
jgi:hypothetical protein